MSSAPGDFGVGLPRATSVAVAVASVYFSPMDSASRCGACCPDKFGRLPIMRVALTGALICGLSSAFAPNLVLLTIARALTGGFLERSFRRQLPTWGYDCAASPTISAVRSHGSDRGGHRAHRGGGLLGTGFHLAGCLRTVRHAGACKSHTVISLNEPDREHRTGVLAALKLFFSDKWAVFVVCLAFVEGPWCSVFSLC